MLFSEIFRKLRHAQTVCTRRSFPSPLPPPPPERLGTRPHRVVKPYYLAQLKIFACTYSIATSCVCAQAVNVCMRYYCIEFTCESWEELRLSTSTYSHAAGLFFGCSCRFAICLDWPVYVRSIHRCTPSPQVGTNTG